MPDEGTPLPADAVGGGAAIAGSTGGNASTGRGKPGTKANKNHIVTNQVEQNGSNRLELLTGFVCGLVVPCAILAAMPPPPPANSLFNLVTKVVGMVIGRPRSSVASRLAHFLLSDIAMMVAAASLHDGGGS